MRKELPYHEFLEIQTTRNERKLQVLMDIKNPSKETQKEIDRLHMVCHNAWKLICKIAKEA